MAEISVDGLMPCLTVEDEFSSLSLLLGRLPSLAPPMDDPSKTPEIAADGFMLRCESAVAVGDASVRAWLSGSGGGGTSSSEWPGEFSSDGSVRIKVFVALCETSGD